MIGLNLGNNIYRPHYKEIKELAYYNHIRGSGPLSQSTNSSSIRYHNANQKKPSGKLNKSMICLGKDGDGNNSTCKNNVEYSQEGTD